MSRWSRFAAIVTALLSVGCSTKPRLMSPLSAIFNCQNI